MRDIDSLLVVTYAQIKHSCITSSLSRLERVARLVPGSRPRNEPPSLALLRSRSRNCLCPNLDRGFTAACLMWMTNAQLRYVNSTGNGALDCHSPEAARSALASDATSLLICFTKRRGHRDTSSGLLDASILIASHSTPAEFPRPPSENLSESSQVLVFSPLALAIVPRIRG